MPCAENAASEAAAAKEALGREDIQRQQGRVQAALPAQEHGGQHGAAGQQGPDDAIVPASGLVDGDHHESDGQHG